MKKLLLIPLLFLIVSCAIKTETLDCRVGTDNLLYGEGTIIGVSLGMSGSNIPTKVTIGYEKYQFISKPKVDKTTLVVKSMDEIGVTGKIIDHQQSIIFGGRDVTHNR